MTDVIQQAREALAEWDAGSWKVLDDPAWVVALRAVVEAADNAHLIDTRRLMALTGTWGVSLDYQHGPEPDWGVVRFDEHSRETVYESGRTAAEALDAAEREAR